ncbi:MAG: class I SAM-dependent methyltransferase [Thiotrichaceae bacterium]|nr:class I SAM-dependent methyltransferase [Thiotrichaceae bacterium]
MSKPTSRSTQTDEFNTYKDDYSQQIEEQLSFAGQNHDFYTKVKVAYLLKQVQKVRSRLSETHLKLLDVGCGHGIAHPFILEQDKEILLYGVDPADEVIEMARKNVGIEYSSNDGITLPYADDTFDVTFTICVMHHVPPTQWQAFLQEMYRVTRKSGELIIFEHNPYNPLTVRIVNNCPLDKNATLLKPKQIKSMMQDISLLEPTNDFILFFPFDFKVFRILEQGLKWLPIGAQYVVHAEK